MGLYRLKRWSSTQPAISLSSGEAELGGSVKGASNGIGFKSMAADLGLHPDVCVHAASSAAINISRRRGLCKILHLSVGDLWVQDRWRNRDIAMKKRCSRQKTRQTF